MSIDVDPKSVRQLILKKGKLDENPIGLHVVMEYRRRTLLGEVRDVWGNNLIVHHFNGEPWPLEPVIGFDNVYVLRREYDIDEE